MNISIFGLGYVGCVSLGCLAQNGHNLIGVDVNPTKVAQINSGKATIIEKDIDSIIAEQQKSGRIRATTDVEDAILHSDISIICVGTPSSSNGHLDLSFVYHVAEQIGFAMRKKNTFHLIAVRSTVLPGTIERCTEILGNASEKKSDASFSVCANPEFLREGTAVADYYQPPFTLIGSDSKRAGELLASIYSDLPAEIVHTDVRTAEMMKYVNNAFHALKIGFANEIGNICSALGLDSHKVMEIFVKDTQLNIAPAYFKPGFSYGGSCLPKDLKALQTIAHDAYLETPILQSISRSNELQLQRALDLITECGKKKIGFLGLSFKEGTDDLRNSPTVALIEKLLGKGYTVSIFDQHVQLSRLTGTNKDFIELHVPHLANLLVDSIETLLADVDCIVVATREKEFRASIALMDSKPIIDLVRIDDRLLAKENYHGICW